MDELRLVRREDQSLIVATEAGGEGREYRLVVDETVLAELRHLSRPSRGPSKINPRNVQALVRAGKTRAEIAEATGLDESDIERYEEPVLAERRYILELAKTVPVRTNQGEEDEQEFGTVIAERLVGLNASPARWSSWRDEEAGWMVGLEFDSHDVAHRAVWTFDHRKNLLTPITPDASTLSKQGDLGERLIPKLRAVDANERFDSGAFDVERLRAEADAESDSDQDQPKNGNDESSEGVPDKSSRKPASSKVAPDHPSTGAIPVVDAGEEYARRQHIEERAIKTSARELPDLGETADLLDALRKRRGERETANEAPSNHRQPARPIPISGEKDDNSAGKRSSAADSSNENQDQLEDGVLDTEEVDGLWDLDKTRIVPRSVPHAVEEPEEDEPKFELVIDKAPVEGTENEPRTDENKSSKRDGDSRKRGKGRASIPSWDDILFGTRSEDDPA